MFIHCKKNLHIQEGSEGLNLKNGFVGKIDDRWAKHWYIKAAVSDGTIETTETAETTETTEKPTKKGKKSTETPKPEEAANSGKATTETTEKPTE